MKILSRFLAVAIFALVLACGGGLTTADYDKIENGMTKSEVEDILGEPTTGNEKGSGGMGAGGMAVSVSVWKDGDTSITVTYLNGKVKGKGKSDF